MVKKSLVLSFGGQSGISFLGALHKIDLSHVTHYYGTSVGALLCFLLAIGLTPFEIFVETCKMPSFSTPNLGEWLLSDSISFASLGLIEHRLCRICEITLGFIPTFAKLAARQKFISIFAFSIKTNETVEFSVKNYPDLNVIDAVIASSSVPLLFPPQKIGNNEFVDGCFFCPIPIESALASHSQPEIIVIYSLPFQLNNLPPKLGLLWKLVTLSISWSITNAKAQFSNEMQIICIDDGPSLLEDLTLEAKWALFLKGLKI